MQNFRTNPFEGLDADTASRLASEILNGFDFDPAMADQEELTADIRLSDPTVRQRFEVNAQETALTRIARRDMALTLVTFASNHKCRPNRHRAVHAVQHHRSNVLDLNQPSSATFADNRASSDLLQPAVMEFCLDAAMIASHLVNAVFFYEEQKPPVAGCPGPALDMDIARLMGTGMSYDDANVSTGTDIVSAACELAEGIGFATAAALACERITGANVLLGCPQVGFPKFNVADGDTANLRSWVVSDQGCAGDVMQAMLQGIHAGGHEQSEVLIFQRIKPRESPDARAQFNDPRPMALVELSTGTRPLWVIPAMHHFRRMIALAQFNTGGGAVEVTQGSIQAMQSDFAPDSRQIPEALVLGAGIGGSCFGAGVVGMPSRMQAIVQQIMYRSQAQRIVEAGLQFFFRARRNWLNQHLPAVSKKVYQMPPIPVLVTEDPYIEGLIRNNGQIGRTLRTFQVTADLPG